MDSQYKKLLGLIVKEANPFEAATQEPLVFLRPLLKKGFAEEELNDLVRRLKKEKVIVKDSVVGDHEFDRVVEINPEALLKLARKE
jgi:hypothetical protein